MTNQLLPVQTAMPDATREAVVSTDAMVPPSMSLLMRLQTTLKVDELLATVDDGLCTFINLTGVFYREPDARLLYRRGHATRHRLCYRLRVEGQSLGEITLYGREEFAEPDIARIEEAATLLHYPLRNALAYRAAVYSSHRDDLTGLYNRGSLDDSLEREMRLAQRHEQAFSLLVLDVDEFKSVNDTWGHLAGDTVLKGVADILRRCSRSSDLTFRYAGDEFVLGLAKTTLEGARSVGRRIVREVREGDFRHGGLRLPVSVSIGVAPLVHGDTPQTLFTRADKALYNAKAAGGGCVA